MRKTILIFSFFGVLLGSGSAETLRFVLIGDPQLEMTRETPGLDKQYFELTVDEINSLNPPADFALVLGDMVHNSNDMDQWNNYFNTIADLNIPYYEVMGNHDGWNKAGLERWRKTWGKKDYYTFTHRGVVFMGLNSFFFKEPEALPAETQAQKDFVASELARNVGNPHLFMFQHYPMFLSDPEEEQSGSKNLPVAEREFLLSQIEAYDVKAVFNGHRHYAIENDYHGTLLLTANPSAKPLGNGKRGYYIVDYDLDAQSVSYQFVENMQTKLGAWNLRIDALSDQ